MSSRAEKAARVLTGFTVAGLAGLAGAISFSHMTELAAEHGQTGWRAFAFPISVDGLEIVASLFLVTQRRAGRRVGILPWVALGVGTAASLAANVAVGGNDLIGRALAGWPAVALLVSIKLLFSMFDHGAEDQRPVRDDHRTVPDGPPVRGTVPGTALASGVPSGTVPAAGTDGPAPSATGADGQPAVPADAGPVGGAVPIDNGAVADLLPAARAAQATLAAGGRALSREALADRMRDDGHAVSNARASLLLNILRTEENVTPIGPLSTGPAGSGPAERPGVAA
jgi:hypothetical protein